MKRSILGLILFTIIILSGCGSTGGNSNAGYTLDISQSGLGTVTVNPVMARYPSRTSVQLTAIPAVDSLFWYWGDSLYGSLISDSDSFKITMDSDKHLEAFFAKETSFYLNGGPLDGSYKFFGEMFKTKRNAPGILSPNCFMMMRNFG